MKSKKSKIVILLIYQFLVDGVNALVGLLEKIAVDVTKILTEAELLVGALTAEAENLVKNVLPNVIQFLNLLKMDLPISQKWLLSMFPQLTIPIDAVMGVLESAIPELLKACGYAPEVIADLNTIDLALPKLQDAINSVIDEAKTSLMNDLALILAGKIVPADQMPANAAMY